MDGRLLPESNYTTGVKISTAFLCRGRINKKGVPQAEILDEDGNGLDDLLVHVETSELDLTPGDTSAALEAIAGAYQVIKGSDTVNIVH